MQQLVEQLKEENSQLRAEVARYRGVLYVLACLGNGDRYGNSTGKCIAQEALATAPAAGHGEDGA